jgi:glycosyltransferase involved in cell wall biosynthesis
MIRKKVCHITNEHPRYDTRIFLKLCKTLVDAGYDVTLLCADNLPEERVDGVHIIPVAPKPKNRFERATKTANALFKKAVELHADVYQLHDPELIRICKKLKKRGFKVIFDSHEDFPAQIMDKTWIPKNLRYLISHMYRYYEKSVVKGLDCVIAVTEPITDRFASYGVKTETIHNYPLLKEFSSLSEADLDEAITKNTSKHADCLCYTGNISVTRGMRTMFSLMEQVDANLILAGKIFVNEDKEFEELLTSHENVEFLGPYTRGQMLEIYSRSKAALLLFYPIENHLNSLPNKLFEYMAGGLPVIASNITFWRPIFEKYQCGVQVDPKNRKALFDAVVYVLTHPQEARKMGEQGRLAVKLEYNWEKESLKLLRIYKLLFC